MIIVGAGGHAKEVVDEWIKKGFALDDIEFYDDTTDRGFFLGRPVHKDMASILVPHEFTIAVGAPNARRKLFELFSNVGHVPYSLIANSAEVSGLNTELGLGLNVMAGVVIGPGVTIGTGVLLNSECHLHHDSSVADFCEISPRVSLLGGVQVQRGVRVGTGAILLPGVIIGEGAVIGAAAMVDRNVEPGSTVIGIPARPVERK